jgi:hypothetical protein
VIQFLKVILSLLFKSDKIKEAITSEFQDNGFLAMRIFL